jgi:hypothetical protein
MIFQEASSIKITRPKLIPKQNCSDTTYYQETVAKTKEFHILLSEGEGFMIIYTSLLFTDIPFKQVK